MVMRDQLRRELERYNRQPFLDLLGEFMQCRPDPVSIAEWAREHPDRWMNAVAVCAKAAGFADETHVVNDVRMTIENMSDAQLLQRLEEMRVQHSALSQISRKAIQPPAKEPASVRNSNTHLEHADIVTESKKRERNAK
jgi:hypothetical protein